jgi:mono/diheme cytochrome c family protein
VSGADGARSRAGEGALRFATRSDADAARRRPAGQEGSAGSLIQPTKRTSVAEQEERMTRTHDTKVLIFAGMVMGLLIAAATWARADDIPDGQMLYLKYCSACHGVGGKGDGVVSQAMRPRPTDLTQLAKKAGGTFAKADIAGRIDGRETSRVHGDPDMPVWGEVLRARGADANAPEDKVILITGYLASIQQK